MSDLTAFLLARITEDENYAHVAAEAGYFTWVEQSSGVLETGEWPEGVHPLGDSRLTRFIARHGPSRVLAECEAKRRIVERYRSETISCSEAHAQFDVHHPGGHGPHPVLLLLALPYAGHPDYRDEWRPGL